MSRLGGQFDRYVRALSWVARDALPRWKWLVLAVVVCNIVGLAATVAAVGGVMAYARAAEQRTALQLLGRTYQLGSDWRSLVLFGAVIAALGLVSAACTYIVDRLILLLARRYHALCAERALMIAADPLCCGWQATEDEPPRATLSRLVGGTSRVMGLVLRNLMRGILPVLTVLATVAFLFYIDSTLTLVLLPATLLYLVPLYLINRRVTRLQRTYRDLSPRARSEVSRRLRDLLDSGELERGAESLRIEALRGEASDGARAAFYGRLLADRRVHLLNTAFFIACLVALLIFFGVRARDHARPWSDLIFYLLALRYAMASLKQVTSLSAKFSRFFPEYRSYARFVTESARTRERRAAVAARPPAVPDMMTLRIGRQARWDSTRTLRLRRPGILLALSPAPQGFVDLEAIAVRIEERLQDDVDIATHAAIIIDADALDAIKPAATVLMPARVASRPRGQEWLVAAQRSAHSLAIIVSESPIEAMNAASPAESASVIVLDGFRIVGGGNRAWLAAHAGEIDEFLKAEAERSRGRGADVGDLDDDDDEGEE